MATKGKTPASRTLNYSLGSDILNRVKGSLDSGSTIKTIDEGLSGITDTVSEASKNIQEERLGQVKEEARKKDEANALYESGMDAFASRASFATPETYDKFMEIEKAERAKYEKAIADGNTELADKILREQKQRAGQQQVWKEVFNGLKDIELLELSDEDKNMIGRLTDQGGDDFKVVYEDGELQMQYTTIGPPFETKKIRGADLDKIIARNKKPTAERKQIGELTTALMDNKAKLKKFDFNDAMANVKDVIKKDNIYSMMKGDLGGTDSGNFLNAVQDHPDFSRISKTDLSLNIKGATALADNDADGDGTLSGEEFLQLSKGDKEEIIKMMQKPENFDIAKHYLAEFITLSQQRKLGDYNPTIPGTSGKTYNDIELENEISKYTNKKNEG